MVTAATISALNTPGRHGCARPGSMAESSAQSIPRGCHGRVGRAKRELPRAGCHGRVGRASATNAENACERFFWALQGVNYNVYGIVSASGDLVERYEYTPYGRRTVYSRGWLRADLNGDGVVDDADNDILTANWLTSAASVADIDGDGYVNLADLSLLVDVDGDSVADDPLVMHSRLESFRTDSQCGSAGGYGSLCDIGHQGLLHDKEFGPAGTGLVHNRRRTLNPPLARFNQRDPLGYPDGMNGYEYVGSAPIRLRDPKGTVSSSSICKCGPDVSDWFARELRLAQKTSDSYGLRSKEYTTFWRSLKYEKAGLSVEGCPSPEKGPCKNTVTLCGVCINTSELGNIAFGYAASKHLSVVMYGGFWAEAETGRGFDTYVDIQAALLGHKYRRHGQKGVAGLCKFLPTKYKYRYTNGDKWEIQAISTAVRVKGGGDVLRAWDENEENARRFVDWSNYISSANRMLQEDYDRPLESLKVHDDCVPCKKKFKGFQMWVRPSGGVSWPLNKFLRRRKRRRRFIRPVLVTRSW